MSAPTLTAKFVRQFAFLRGVRGWQRLANKLCSRHGTFEIDLGGVRLSGKLSSYIDRQSFLFDGNERDQIELFLRAVPRGGTALDVGANIGNHSVLFSKHFERVVCFEPNPELWPTLEHNASLNPTRSITVRRVGLSDEAADLPFYNIENGNMGLGTFAATEQYDQKLKLSGIARVEVADELLGDIELAAIKIDVQGFEPQVLRGMRAILKRNRPVVWAEFGQGTAASGDSRRDVEELFPYPIVIQRFVARRGILTFRLELQDYSESTIELGDYLIKPA